MLRRLDIDGRLHHQYKESLGRCAVDIVYQPNSVSERCKCRISVRILQKMKGNAWSMESLVLRWSTSTGSCCLCGLQYVLVSTQISWVFGRNHGCVSSCSSNAQEYNCYHVLLQIMCFVLFCFVHDVSWTICRYAFQGAAITELSHQTFQNSSCIEEAQAAGNSSNVTCPLPLLGDTDLENLDFKSLDFGECVAIMAGMYVFLLVTVLVSLHLRRNSRPD